MTKSLLLFDTDHIKRYVFATDKLREIRAASALLDKLNRQDMPTIAGGEETKVFANGGSGLFLVDSDRVDSIIRRIGATYRKVTATASITGVAVNGLVEEVNWDTTDISTQREMLGYKLIMAKDGQSQTVPLLTHSFLNYCRSCGEEYAVNPVTENNQPKLVCAACKKKVDYDKVEIKEKIQSYVDNVSAGKRYMKEDGLWPYLITELYGPSPSQKQNYRSYLKGFDRPETFDELAKLSQPGEYLALIYADGDAMGQQLEKIRTLQQMVDFAEAVDNSIYQATVEAIGQYLVPRDGTVQWPFDILLLGGDDLVMVTRAESALEVAAMVMQRFTELANQAYTRKYQDKMPEGETLQPLHISVGVTIAHANYPFGELLRLTESSLKFAKKEAARHRQRDEHFHEGMLNFLVVSSANHLDFKQFYKDQLHVKAEYTSTEPNLYRSLRPYTAAEFQKLLASVRLLRDLNTPRTKLEQLRALLFQTKQQSMVDALSLLFHWRSERQRSAIQQIVADFNPEKSEAGLQFPWFQREDDEQRPEYLTPLLDLIEIYDFISPEEPADANHH